ERMLVSGVAADKNVARISVLGVKNEPGIAFKIFNLLAKHNMNVDIIIQSIGREEKKDISFTVAKTDLKDALELLEQNKESITAQAVTSEENVAKLSIIGAGMMSNPGVAAKMFEALSNANVNIKMIATSEIRITVLIHEEDVNRAMRSVHDAFDLAD
ncbi:MAG: ACT domain-containing protein, partial [Lacrimispora sp.]|uniref:ACT domain-containing protein n=1 Tax=Lacrimispora sp. TaxID=2719234 RepID=UPI0039E6C4F2